MGFQDLWGLLGDELGPAVIMGYNDQIHKLSLGLYLNCQWKKCYLR